MMAYSSPMLATMQTSIFHLAQGDSERFIRLPPTKGRCQWSGLPRSTMNALILPTKGNNYRPPVASYVVKTSKNAKRGTRIISLSSLMAHIRAESNSVSDLPNTPSQETASSGAKTGEEHAP